MINLESVKVTPRDQQVLNLLVQGCSNKEIAGQLNISPRTVKQHFANIVSACRYPRRAEAREVDNCDVQQRGGAIMTPRERLTKLPSWSGRDSRTGRSAGSSAPANRSSRIIFETRSTSSACGAGWSWPCTSPAMVERTGRKPTACPSLIPRPWELTRYEPVTSSYGGEISPSLVNRAGSLRSALVQPNSAKLFW
jgi:hypothetical protein